MPKTLEKLLLILTDFIFINLTFFLWVRMRYEMGYYAEIDFTAVAHMSLIIYGFWVILFGFLGMYRIHYAHSRTDEFISVAQVVTVGIFVLFILTIDLRQDVENPFKLSRMLMFLYWGMMIFIVGAGRIILRSIYRRLLELGIGHRKTLILGWGKKAKEIYDEIAAAPALGYKVVGFVIKDDQEDCGQYKGVRIRGKLSNLNRIIKRGGIQEVIIAFTRRSESLLESVIMQCDGTQAGIKIVPDLYDIIIGQVKTNQLYGFPLIEILPQLMPYWERVVKRLLDIVTALIGIVLFLPFGILISLLILIDNPGPVFYSQERVGKNEKLFKVHKFRTMVKNAEKLTGPVWAGENDPRITRIGRILRKLRLDEFPQLINVLDGDMSIVGPRPERLYFVEQLKEKFPLYPRRHRIRPGITGWAQVKGNYDTSLEAVKYKLEFDLFYIENMSLRMDLKIILHTIHVMLRGKGQ